MVDVKEQSILKSYISVYRFLFLFFKASNYRLSVASTPQKYIVVAHLWQQKILRALLKIIFKCYYFVWFFFLKNVLRRRHLRQSHNIIYIKLQNYFRCLMFMRAQHTLLLFVDYLLAKTILTPSTTYPRNRIRYQSCTLQKQNVVKSITIHNRYHPLSF